MAQPDFDQARFIAALTRYQPALEAFCHAQLANRQDAREALQATCVKLWEKAADWDAETEFLPWAFAVARFTVLSHIRDRMCARLGFVWVCGLVLWWWSMGPIPKCRTRGFCTEA